MTSSGRELCRCPLKDKAIQVSQQGQCPAMKNAGGDSGEGCVCRQAGFGTALISSRQVTRERKTVPLYGLRSGHTSGFSSRSRPAAELKLQTQVTQGQLRCSASRVDICPTQMSTKGKNGRGLVEKVGLTLPSVLTAMVVPPCLQAPGLACALPTVDPNISHPHTEARYSLHRALPQRYKVRRVTWGPRSHKGGCRRLRVPDRMG